MKPTKNQFTVLKQVFELIPRNLVAKLAKKHGVDKQSRTFKPWSYIVALVFGQLAHALSLNDICDTLRNHVGVLTSLRRATPPSRNGLSHANRERNADMAEELFWGTLKSLSSSAPEFGMGRNYSGFPHRFHRRIINIVDSTTIPLVASCIDWAKHRRRKAAAKCHMRLDLGSFLPHFAVVKEASTHDATEARRVCVGMEAGEIVAFDKAYVDFSHLYELNERDVFWVTRAKSNMQYKVARRNSKPSGNIKRDVIIRLKVKKSREQYPATLRLVAAMVEINGKEQMLTFLINNMEWAASSICDLYKAR